MKSRTRKNPDTDPEFAYEMLKRRHGQDERINLNPYRPRSKYLPNELPLYVKSKRKEMKHGSR